MRMKKILSMVVTILLVAVLALTGCSSKNQETSGPTDSTGGPKEEPKKEPKQEQVTITLNGWGSSPTETELFNQVIADFEATHPHIKVNFEVIADQYMDVIKTRLVGGEAGDVFYLDAFEAPAMMEQNVLEPLNSYVTGDFDLADFEEPLLNAFKSGDQIYGFPKDFSTLALFYNKKAFADAGITAPPKTWVELLEYSKKLTVDKNGTKQYGLGIAPELARQFFMIEAFGGHVVNDEEMASFASPDGLRGLQLVVDQYTIDKTSVQPSDVGAGWGGEVFGQEKVAMVIEGNWAIPYLQETFSGVDFGTAEVPTVGGKKGTMAYTVAYVMNKESKHKKEAWELISYLTGKEGMKKWTSLGLALPTRKSVAAELGFDKDPLRGALVAGAGYATPWQAGPNLPIIMNNFNNQFISAVLGQQDLQSAMENAQETANKEIKASK